MLNVFSALLIVSILSAPLGVAAGSETDAYDRSSSTVTTSLESPGAALLILLQQGGMSVMGGMEVVDDCDNCAQCYPGCKLNCNERCDAYRICGSTFVTNPHGCDADPLKEYRCKCRTPEPF